MADQKIQLTLDERIAVIRLSDPERRNAMSLSMREQCIAALRGLEERDEADAVVFIGDAMEENIDDLADKAGKLGLRGVPVFVFQEGPDTAVERSFREIARLSRGAWFRFDRDAASTLARLLSAVAVFATGGLKALEARGRPEDRLMIENLRGKG